ncbi:transglutaminase-like domain-containing protein [bacterium]|nr:transglutaminase-like domain-containing protein [bacterium]
MTPSKKTVRIVILSGILTILFFSGLSYIFVKSYQDPRWRIFDFNSRQASEGEIYNVAEVHAIKSIKLVGPRKLRFEFTPPFQTEAWKILTAEERREVSRDVYPEIQFSDKPSSETYVFIPEDVKLLKEIVINISFYPKENYTKQGLSWPDNYYSPYSSIPFSITEPYSLDEWTGLTDKNPEIIEARSIMGNAVSMYGPVLERSEQVFRFVMEKIEESGGTPSDKVQDASPLETYEMLSGGTGKGWCENWALAYYLFANAAGIKTRLVDLAGKFGPLKLTGHYFCESWDPIQAKWYFVDPMSRAANIKTSSGRLLDTLEIKKMFDLDKFTDETVLTYNHSTRSLDPRPHTSFYNGNKGYFTGDVVLAYKFGYPRNKEYSRVGHFLHYPTLLYAPFALPKLCMIKTLVMAGFIICAIITGVSGLVLIGDVLKT